MLTVVIFSCFLRMLFERIADKCCFRSDWKCSLAIFFRGFLENLFRESLTCSSRSFLRMLFPMIIWKDAWECCLCGFFEVLFENMFLMVLFRGYLKCCWQWIVANNHLKWFFKYCFSHVFQAKSFKVSLIVS